MTQEDKWNEHWLQITQYIKTFKRCPSKHRLEDHRMLNWIKYNKKLIAKGKLPTDKVAKFDQLVQLADKYRKKNQYAYLHNSPDPNQLELELLPFD